MATLRSLAERQRQFASALFATGLTIPPELMVQRQAHLDERFAVYRNNVAVGLIEALRSSFPVVGQLVGDEFFSAMARGYSRARPPSSPVLLGYGDDFPDFIRDFEPAGDLPYLADVATLEWLWLESYHAADAPAFSLSSFNGLDPDTLPNRKLSVHPAMRLVQLTQPVLAIWNAHQRPGGPGEILLGDEMQRLLIVRPEAEVSIIQLTVGGYAFLGAIEGQATIAEALEAALDLEPDINAAALFSCLFEAGAFGAGKKAGQARPGD